MTALTTAKGVWSNLVCSSIADQRSAELQQQIESIPSRVSVFLNLPQHTAERDLTKLR